MGPVIIKKEILDYTVQPRSRKDMFKDILAFTESKLNKFKYIKHLLSI